MTRADFLKLIPAAILALFWPEAKAEAAPTHALVDGSNFSDGHDRVFVFGGVTEENPRRARVLWERARQRIVVDDKWLEGAE